MNWDNVIESSTCGTPGLPEVPGTPDNRCADPVFAAANPTICDPPAPYLLIRPEYALKEPGQVVTYSVSVVLEGVEILVDNADVAFSTSAAGVATVGADGVSNTLAVGSTSITASHGNMTVSARLEVVADCASEVFTFVLLFDTSKSMGLPFGESIATKLDAAKDTALAMLPLLDFPSERVLIGQFNSAGNSSFETVTTPASAQSAIQALQVSTNRTNLSGGLSDAAAQFTAGERKVIIMFTDGENKEGGDPVVTARNFRTGGGVLIGVGVRAYSWGLNVMRLVAGGGFLANLYEAVYADAKAEALLVFNHLCGECCEGSGEVSYGNIAPSIADPGPVSTWNGGNDFAPGTYRVLYKFGAAKYFAGDSFRVNFVTDVGACYRYYVTNAAGAALTQAPIGNANSFATQGEVEADNAGAFVEFVHTGGPIGMRLCDDNYADNTAGTSSPTFELKLIGNCLGDCVPGVQLADPVPSPDVEEDPIRYVSTKSYTAECPIGEVGADVTATATASSFLSQVDADARALAAAQAAAEGQLHCDGEDEVVELDGARFEMPCINQYNGGDYCTCTDPSDQVATLSGNPLTTYAVTLRFRGWVETFTRFSGVWDGAFFQTGGAAIGGVVNVYSLVVSDPPQTYFLNSAASFSTHLPIDYTKTIPIKGGATVKLVARSQNGTQGANPDNYVVPGVPPAPAAFDGQFIQVDVVSIV